MKARVVHCAVFLVIVICPSSCAWRRYFNTFLTCCLALGCALVVLALRTRYRRLEFDRAHASAPPRASACAPDCDASPSPAACGRTSGCACACACACAPSPSSAPAPVEGERGGRRGAEAAGAAQASFENSEPRVYSNRIWFGACECSSNFTRALAFDILVLVRVLLLVHLYSQYNDIRSSYMNFVHVYSI